MTDTDRHDFPPHDGRYSRREFLLRGLAGAGAASWIAHHTPTARANPESIGATTEPPPFDPPDVVQVRSDDVITPRGVHEGVLRDLVAIALRRLTGKEPADGWRTLLRPDDVIALKFNRSGADGLGITDPLLRVLLESLGDAGFDPRQIVTIEVSPAIRKETGTQPPRAGWTEDTVDFGSGSDRLAAWLEPVTAIINVPFLKTHNIAGLTCALKNLSHAVVKHPAQFHGNGCAPYIGDIVALPQVRSKLRLHLVNALRVVFDGGPAVTEDCIWDAGTLLAGRDPVALDAVGLKTLDRVRTKLGLPRIATDAGPPAYLRAAAERGLGTCRLHRVKLVKAKL
jgi:hypothetical protein